MLDQNEIEVEKEIAEINKQTNQKIIIFVAVLLGLLIVHTNQFMVCDKISDICNSKILGFNISSVPLSQVQTADFSVDAKYRASKGFQTYNTKLITKYSQTIDFYLLRSLSEFKAQDDSRAFNDFLASDKTHFEAKSGLASLAFWQFF